MREIKHKNKTLEIHVDEEPMSPREWDNLGTIVAFHRRYNLGDIHKYNQNDYQNWCDLKSDIIKNEKVGVILPLYLYDHSGISISTSPFQCKWDSGQIGFIFASKDTIRKEFGIKRVTKKYIEKVTSILESEIKVYDQYLTGDVYGFVLKVDDQEVDSCWGFYGDDHNSNGMVDHIQDKEISKLLSTI